MTKCCKICYSPIEDENSIVLDHSYDVFHRHCFHPTKENYCNILAIGTFKNVKEKYSFLFNSPQKMQSKPKSFAKNVIFKFNQRKSS
jgi:hypothetical protein